MMKRKLTLILSMLLLSLLCAGCGLFSRQGEDVAWGEGGEEAVQDIKQFALFDEFEISQEKPEDFLLTLHFKSKKYGDFSITGLELSLDELLEIKDYFGDAYGYEVDGGKSLLIPFTLQMTTRDWQSFNRHYTLETKEGKLLDRACVFTRAEKIKGSKVETMARWVDENWPGTIDGASAARLSETRYCDLTNYLSGSSSEYSHLSQQWLQAQAQNAQGIQELEEKLLRSYYALLFNRDFDRLFQVSLFKGELKQANPFHERYAGMWSGAVLSITAKGDHTYDVVAELEYCRKVDLIDLSYYYTGYDCENPEVKKYRATKRILADQDKVRVDGVASTEITRRWVCDKKVGEYKELDGVGCPDGDCGLPTKEEYTSHLPKSVALEPEKLSISKEYRENESLLEKTSDGKHTYQEVVRAGNCRFLFDDIVVIPTVWESYDGNCPSLYYNTKTSKLYQQKYFDKEDDPDYIYTVIFECRLVGEE